MKAWLYLVRKVEGWHSQWTISLDVDIRYWSAGREIVVWREPLPIAQVEKACLMVSKFLNSSHYQSNRKVSDMIELMNRMCGILGDTSGNGVLIGGSPEAQSTTEFQELMSSAEVIGDRLKGHALLSSEVETVMEDMLQTYGSDHLKGAIQLASLLGYVELAAAIGEEVPGSTNYSWLRKVMKRNRKQEQQCRRCGSNGDHLRLSPCASCGHNCAYCERCLTMGRTRECGLLIRGIRESLRKRHTPHKSAGQLGFNRLESTSSHSSNEAQWTLSPAQAEAAGEALQFIRERLEGSDGVYSLTKGIKWRTIKDTRTFLLWAVTGAGKTEMIFPLIEEVVQSGGRVVVATPRKDVVLELAPRLAVAFPYTSLIVLYGGSPDRFGLGSITLATTHQLLRCHEAFDLVLIDELDAYPYHNNPMLHFAAAKSRKQEGVTVLLSATPPRDLMRQAARGQLPHARVPVRYHLHPLPVPKRINAMPLAGWIRKGAIPSALLTHLQHSIVRGAQLFVFVPYIADVNKLVGFLREQCSVLGLPSITIEGTSSKDTVRGDKVNDFRGRTIRLLVTTTILERGVTVPKSDVYVIGADNPQFDCSALVQMAGRAGRSGDDPYGHVYFVGKALTKSQQEAIQQIRQMNRVAKNKGYLNGQEKLK